MSGLRKMLAGALIVGACSATAQAADATVDWTKPYQTVEGFGFFGPMDVWWGGGPFFSDAWGNLIMQDLGITMWRNEYYSEEGSQDANWAKQRPAVQSLKTKSDALGVDLKFIYSVWSPPSQWKSNRSLKNGGTLETQYYDEYGAWLKAGVKNYADIGINLYALSAQNEPAFAQFYNSCVFTPEQYRDMVKIAGPIVHETYPTVKFFGAEDMLANWATGFPGRLMGDPLAKVQVGALAVHGYDDGVHPTPASTAASLWGSAARNCATAKIPLWMTETSGHAADWSGSFQLGESIYAALKFGKIAAWVYWYGIGDLCTSTGLNKKGYVSKQYFRYIRPGAVMYDVTDVSSQGLYVIAFAHAGERTMTVVALNPGSAATLNLLGTSLPSTFTMYRTTSGDNCVSAGTVNKTGISVPANSIVTLYATNFTPPAVAVGQKATAAARVAQISRDVAYDLQGRVVNAKAGNMTCRVQAEQAGRAANVTVQH